MKFKKLLVATAAASLAFTAQSVMADPNEHSSPQTQDFWVTAEIKDVCYLDAAGNVDFGELYPGWKGPEGQHVEKSKVKFRCTKGTSYELSFDQGDNFGAYANTTGSRKMVHTDGAMDGMGEIPYWLLRTPEDDGNELGEDGGYGTSDHGVGQGLSTTEELEVFGKIYEADIADVLTGSYKDTVTVSLSF